MKHSPSEQAELASSRPAPPAARQNVSVDDVVHAYRWILGREPESLGVIERHLATLNSRADLRKRFLSSHEFKGKYAELTAGAPLPRLAVLPEDTERIIFLHVPKTGGTTLHELLVQAVGKTLVCAERHNGLWRCSGADLAGARLFSGHYDRRCVSFVPGRRVRVVTLLREPRQRLLSLYRFLRAHGPKPIAADDLELARVARELDLGEFLRAALEINPASVDNTYLRAFGAALPRRRWEQRAEPEARCKLDELGLPIEELVTRAAAFLDGMAAVGVLEEFDRSLASIFTALALQRPETYEPKMRLAQLVAANPNFEPVAPIAPTEEDERLLAELTRFDLKLYQQAQAILARASDEAC